MTHFFKVIQYLIFPALVVGALQFFSWSHTPISRLEPERILRVFARDLELIVWHAGSTILCSVLGVLFSWILAFGLCWPVAPKLISRVGSQFMVVANALPLVAIVSLLTLLVPRGWLAVVLAMFTSAPVIWEAHDQWLTSARRFIKNSPFAVYNLRTFDYCRILSSSLFTGPCPQLLKAGFPLALFGATLSGFVFSDRGLGTYLSVAMWQGDINKVFAAAIVTVSLAAIAYLTATVIEKMRPGELQLVLESEKVADFSWKSCFSELLLGVGAALVVWLLVTWVGSGNPFIKSPFALIHPSKYPPEFLSRVISAVGETLFWSVPGWIVGLLAACCFVAANQFLPSLRIVLLPVLFVSQTVPLTVLVSMIVACGGRGVVSILIFAVSVSFFSSIVILGSGLSRLYVRYGELEQVYGRKQLNFWRFIVLPGIREYLSRAIVISAPRAVLGVVLCEYLVQRRGIGGLMFDARGRMELESLWFLIVIVVFVGIICNVIARQLVPNPSSMYLEANN